VRRACERLPTCSKTARPGTSSGSSRVSARDDADSGFGANAAIAPRRCLPEAKQRCGRAIAGFAAYSVPTMTRDFSSGWCESSPPSRLICLPAMRTRWMPHASGVRKSTSSAATTGVSGIQVPESLPHEAHLNPEQRFSKYVKDCGRRSAPGSSTPRPTRFHGSTNRGATAPAASTCCSRMCGRGTTRR
jgi:hypothetical protein